MSENHRRNAEQIRDVLGADAKQLKENTRFFNAERYAAVKRSPNHEQYRTKARKIKEAAIDKLPSLIEETRDSVESNGGTVFVANDAKAANEYIIDLLATKQASKVVKSKSMTTEEIALNDALEDDHIDVWETDLGEFVIQVADDSPSHLVGPSLHISREEITDLFESEFSPDEDLDSAEKLTKFARDFLGEHIETADVGITGANFVMANHGSIALITNEGNARKCAAFPETHIAIAGIEKIIPQISDLHPFIELLARSATGQDITQYVSIFSPPVDTPIPAFDYPDRRIYGEDGDERDFHLILLDNGRTEMRDDPDLRETLYCIRCGACANSCANFQSVGGHIFGGETYTGGIATGWETGTVGLESAGSFNDLCTGCSRCVNACPVKIDIPWINTVVRDRINRHGETAYDDILVDGLFPDEEPIGVSLKKRFLGNFGLLARLGSATAPLSNMITSLRPIRKVLESAVGIDSRRELPTFERQTLRKWMDARDSTVPDPERKVVLFPDVYTNYIRPARGKAAVRTLEALGCSVTIPAVGDTGRAPLSQGMIATAESCAASVNKTLVPYLNNGYDIVIVEPSDVAMLRRDYEKLLSADEFSRLSDSSYEVMEYVYGLLENGADAGNTHAGTGEQVAYHSHCQQRTLGLTSYTTSVLNRLGYDVTTSDVECCGMAGSFGYKTEYYDLSMDVGQTLAEQFEEHISRRTIAASGISCTDQLDSLLPVETSHPIELIDPARST